MVGEDNIHFTVKFLGDVPDAMVHEIDARINGLELHSVEVTVRGVGVFPDLQRPRGVWAWVAAQDAERIESLSNRIITALDGIGKPEDHEFHAHITLARVRGPRNREALVSFVRENSAIDFGTTRIASLKLKSSVLTSGGPIYSDVRGYALG
jgi:2'-5' RNA ligase